MNISALWVFVFAVMTAGYTAIRCSDCDQPCSPDELENVTNEYSKLMSFPPSCKNTPSFKKVHPTWEWKRSVEQHRTPELFCNITCRTCGNHEKALEILQDFNMLYKTSCPDHSHGKMVLKVRKEKVSIGCRLCVL